MSSGRRRACVDWARGLAVLLMIEAHTVDAWTRAGDRASAAFRHAIILGGFAAPLFLWLAGVSVVLAASSIASREGSRAAAVDAVCRRGLEIFVLAFLFRLQAFIVTPGSDAVALFRVDILNIMGPSIALAAIVWGACVSPVISSAVFGAIAAAFAMATPLVRSSALIDALPIWTQWYLRPAGEHTNFTAFPWAGFVFAGAAIGIVLVHGRSSRRAHAAIGAAGAALIGLGFYTAALPSIYRDASFWTSSPTYFAIRVGILMLALAALYALETIVVSAAASLQWLQRFGRRSLLVYWVHVELVYGYATWWVHRRLPVAVTFGAFAMFSALMYGLIALVESPRWRPVSDRTVQAT